MNIDPLLAPTVDAGGPIDIAHAAQHWHELLRVGDLVAGAVDDVAGLLLTVMPRRPTWILRWPGSTRR